MEAKEKALQLVDKYLGTIIFNIQESIDASILPAAKQCALICVDETIITLKGLHIGDKICKENVLDEIEYLKEVKQEIEKL